MKELHLTNNELDLLKYIPDKERLVSYVERMRHCKSMDEVESRVLIPMLEWEPNVTAESAEKKDFYTRLQPFIGHLRGAGNTALYERICRLNVMLRKADKRKQSFAGLLQQLELPVPKAGEETRCLVELVITPQGEDGRMLAVTATLAGVECWETSNEWSVKGDARRIAALLVRMQQYWDDHELSIRYRSARLVCEGLTLSQALVLAEAEV